MKMSLEEAVEVGLRFHRAGQLKQAEEIYQQILAYDPRNPDAMHLMGLLAHQAREYAIAIQFIERAISVKPDAAVFHYNLSEAFRLGGRLEDAVASLRKTLELEPEYVDAANNLGLVLLQCGNAAGSESACRRALELDSEFASAWNNLGNALRAQSRFSEAIEAYLAAIRMDDNYAEAWSNMAICYNELQQYDAGIEALRTAIRIRPEFADAYNNLGVSYYRKGLLTEAEKTLRTAIKLSPESTDARINLAAVFRATARNDEAIIVCKEALERNADLAIAHNNLAAAYKETGEIDLAIQHADRACELRADLLDPLITKALALKEKRCLADAISCIEKVLEKDPNHVVALNCLGIFYAEIGYAERSVEYVRRSLGSFSDPHSHSNLLLYLNYPSSIPVEEVAQQHIQWGKATEELFTGHRKRLASRPRRRSGKIRVGYVSPDYKYHPVSYFCQSFFRNHDRDQFELFSYAHVIKPDMMTMYLQSLVPNWRSYTGATTLKLAEMAAHDEIDILVDLAGHTGFSGIAAFAMKPAPVQVSMIGYPNTTGLSVVDYRITDAQCDPAGETEVFSSETLWRMPEIFWCYTPHEPSPEIKQRAAGAPIRFCSMNNPAKVSNEALRLWAEILHKTPGSTLLIQGGGFHEAISQGRIYDVMGKCGIEASRLEISGSTPIADYFQRMTECDIALDTFPFNGGTTTCHKLWNGLPVVALRGRTHVSRMGHSILHCVGLGDLVAETPEDYVRIAVQLAADGDRLRQLRMTMRERLLASPLLDEVGYTRHLENAYRTFTSRLGMC